MQDILAADVNKLPGHASATSLDIPANTLEIGSASGDPYYFSRGSIKFAGTEFARIRSFSLTVSNNEEPR